MGKIEDADAAVRAAISLAMAHLEGDRGTSLAAELDVQIRRFVDRLRTMERDLASGTLKPSAGEMSYAIADGWPHTSELGEAIVKAEQLYKRAGVE